MKILLRGSLAGIIILFVGFLVSPGNKAQINHHSVKPVLPEQGVLKPDLDFGKIPLYFIPNRGQVNQKALYYARTPKFTLWITRKSLVFDVINPEKLNKKDMEKGIAGEGLASSRINSSNKINREVSRMEFIDSNPDCKIIPMEKTMHQVNYFRGKNKAKWKTGINTSLAVLYKEIYPHIDLKIYGKESCIEYDWIVKPGGDPGRIKFSYKGLTTKLDKKGNILIKGDFGELKHKKPYAYQNHSVGANGNSPSCKGRTKVKTQFVKTGKDSYEFSIDNYNKTKPLIIDPVVLVYSTYLGGGSFEFCIDIAVDSAGCAYTVGMTLSNDYPTENPYRIDSGIQHGDYEAFVTKLSAAGNSLEYSTYLGGTGPDYGWGIAVDSGGSAYVTGRTDATDFPTVNPVMTDPGDSDYDCFVTKLSPAGNSLTYSTYLGGSDRDTGHGVDVDSTGNAYILGRTYSTDFPTQNPYMTDPGDSNRDCFVCKLSATGNTLVYSTYLGGNGDDLANRIVADSSGNALVTGRTGSTDFPTQNPIMVEPGDAHWDGFVTKFSPAGNALIYSTYLGGSSMDSTTDIDVDRSGSAYISGYTSSADFPTRNPIMGYVGAGNYNNIVSKLSASGALVYSTYLGGTGGDMALSISVDSSRFAYVTGLTQSADFPIRYPCQANNDGSSESVFAFKLPPAGNYLVYSTTFWGTGHDEGWGIAVDSSGSAYICGDTVSTDFPTVNPYMADPGDGEDDGFVSKLSFTHPDIAVEKSVNNSTPQVGDNVTYTVVVTNHGPGYVDQLRITDQLPQSLSYVSAAASRGSYSPNTGVWRVGSLSARRSADLRITAKVTENGTFVNTAFLTPGTHSDTAAENNTASVEISTSFTVTAKVTGGNGMVAPSSQVVIYGGNCSVSITPDAGYEIASITDNGVSKSIANPYALSEVTENHEVIVSFKPAVTMGLSGERKTDSAWILKILYAELELTLVDPSGLAKSFTLQRSEGGGKFTGITSFTFNDLDNGTFTYRDTSIKKNMSYQYKVKAFDASGKLISESKVIQL